MHCQKASKTAIVHLSLKSERC